MPIRNEELPHMPPAVPKPPRDPNFVVLICIEHDDGGPGRVFRVHSKHYADNQGAAKKLAIRGDDELNAQVEAGTAPVLAAVPMRSWKPKKPTARRGPSILEV